MPDRVLKPETRDRLLLAMAGTLLNVINLEINGKTPQRKDDLASCGAYLSEAVSLAMDEIDMELQPEEEHGHRS